MTNEIVQISGKPPGGSQLGCKNQNLGPDSPTEYLFRAKSIQINVGANAANSATLNIRRFAGIEKLVIGRQNPRIGIPTASANVYRP